MSRIHVFAADRLASLDGVASGPGLRGTQLVQALRAGGHDISVSIPADAWPQAAPGRGDAGQGGAGHPPVLHNRRTYLDLLNRMRPEVVVWMQPLLRNTPFSAGALHVCDLHGSGAPATDLRDRVVRHAAGAGLVLLGSAGQDGFWMAGLEQAAGASAIVPYATPPDLLLPPRAGASALRRLHVPGGMHLRPGGLAWLARAAAWCGAHGIGLHVGAAPGVVVDVGTMQALHALEDMPGVHLSGTPELRALLDGYGPGSLLLDLADGWPDRCRSWTPWRMACRC